MPFDPATANSSMFEVTESDSDQLLTSTVPRMFTFTDIYNIVNIIICYLHSFLENMY